MIAPTPRSAASTDPVHVQAPVKDERPPLEAQAPEAKTLEATPDWSSAEGRAREMLDLLGRGDHPDSEHDPIHALYQVAIDYRCSAHGYRELYLHHMRHAAD